MGILEDYRERHALGVVTVLIRNINELIGLTLYPLDGDELNTRERYSSIITITPENAKSFIAINEIDYIVWNQSQIDLSNKIIDGLNRLQSELATTLSSDNLFSINAHLKEYRIEIRRGRRKKAKTEDVDEFEGFDSSDDFQSPFPTLHEYDDFDRATYSAVGFKSPYFQLKERIDCLYTICSAIAITTANTKLVTDLANTLANSRKVMTDHFNDLYKEIVSQKLSLALKDLNVTQAELAYAIGVSRQTVHSWCSGVMYPTLDKLIVAANYLNVSTDYLLRPDVDKQFGMDEQSMFNEYGITQQWAEKIRDMNRYGNLTETLDLIISNYSYFRSNKLDILSALNKYLKSECSSYLITESDIEELTTASTKSDSLKTDMEKIISRIKNSGKNDLTALQELEDVIVAVKQSLSQNN